jgi:uncharacterized membrane protein YccC
LTVHPARWLASRDRGLAALRRAGRAAVVMPAMFAVGDKVIANATVASFAAFGSFALLLLVDFGGPMRDRLQAQAALSLAGGALVCLGTLASRTAWLAAVSMAAIGFGILFAGVVSSVLAAATPALLLAFILPVSLKAPSSSIPDRLWGWGMASGAAIIAVAVLWPAPANDRLRTQAAAACRATAARLRAAVAASSGAADADADADATTNADEAVGLLHRTFLATPYRPTGLGTASRTVIRLVDELAFLNTIAVKACGAPERLATSAAACAVNMTAAAVLERGAQLLDVRDESPGGLRDAVAKLRRALDAVEQQATVALPRPDAARAASLDTIFRAQELGFLVTAIAANISLAAAADRRRWFDRLRGRRPEGVPSTLSAAQRRAAAHVERHSVWLHNSIRGAVGLGAAIFVANVTGVQHSFWVVFGTLAVLRSNALNTGQNLLRGLLGTTVGFAIGAALIAPAGSHTTPLWLLLPLAILVAGVAPAAISFAAGQAGFTVTLVILYNIIAPSGWRVGLLRVEDVAIGGAVSLAVGLLLWPRGAAAALRTALAEGYLDSAHYLGAAVDFAMSAIDVGTASRSAAGVATRVPAPSIAADRAAAAARRLDDAFRSYLAERGPKPVSLAEITRLATGVAIVRLTADAVVEMWSRDGGDAGKDRTASRDEVLRTSQQVQAWYADLASSLDLGAAIPDPLDHDDAAIDRLLAAVSDDLRAGDGQSAATGIRVIWTSEHLDAVRRLQTALVEPARAATATRPRALNGSLHSRTN